MKEAQIAVLSPNQALGYDAMWDGVAVARTSERALTGIGRHPRWYLDDQTFFTGREQLRHHIKLCVFSDSLRRGCGELGSHLMMVV